MQVPKSLAVAATAIGIAGGSFGIASAANGGRSTTTTATTTTTTTTPSAPSTQPAPPAGPRFGHQRSDETPLTGGTLSKVEAAAEAKVSGGTVVRAETDADGHGKYEVHMLDASGNPVTVYVDANYTVVSTRSPF